VSINGSNGTPHFRVRFDRQHLADSLAQQLSDTDVSVQTENGSWIVSIDNAKTDQLVVRVLDATRATLSGQPAVSAHVLLNGREYVMRGEISAP